MKYVSLICLLWALLMSLTSSAFSSPTNDAIAHPLELTKVNNMVVANNEDASIEPGEPDFPDGGLSNASLWYKYKATANEKVTFVLEDYNSYYNNTIQIFSGDRYSTIKSLAYAQSEHLDYGSSFRLAAVSLNLRKGSTVLIRVATKDGSEQWTYFRLRLFFQKWKGGIINYSVPYTGVNAYGFSLARGYNRISDTWNFSGIWVVVNTLTKSKPVSYATNLPNTVVSVSEAIVPGIRGANPGISIVRISDLYLADAISDVYNYFTVKVGKRNFYNRIHTTVFRTDRAYLDVSSQSPDLHLGFGDFGNAVFKISNSTQFSADKCRLHQAFNQWESEAFVRYRWRVTSGSAWNKPFSVPPGRSVDVIINYQMLHNNLNTNSEPYFVCSNADSELENYSDIYITSTD